MMDTEADIRSENLIRQERLLPFLCQPDSYPHHPRSVELVQTHASFVFLAGPFVYKVKKAVNFGFLDFSTLEKRRHFCEQEVILNRRLCPDVYLGIVAISRTRGQYAFGEGDEILEYAIRMRKLSERGFLHKMLERDAVTLGDLDRIADALKRFYEAQHPTREIESWGSIDRLRISTDENFRQTEEFVGNTLSRAAFETIRFYTDEFYKRRASLFRSRVEQRWIRDCHGDLHAEHIHLTPQAVRIYDCIEFNDRLRYVDIASDVAFLAMDLDWRGRRDLGKYFAERISSVLKDSGMLPLMNFYKCYRAYVRGKVESLQSVAHAATREENERCVQRAKRYNRLALQYALAGSEPFALVVMGRVGSGKSTLAKALSEELGWKVLSSDTVRKKMAGVPVHGRGDARVRREIYSPEMTEKTYETLSKTAIAEAAQGRSVILDATFARAAHRDQLKRRFATHGIRYRMIEAQASDGVIKERLKYREKNSDEVSDARLEDFEKLKGLFEPTDSEEDLIRVPTIKPVEETVTSLFRQLATTQA